MATNKHTASSVRNIEKVRDIPSSSPTKPSIKEEIVLYQDVDVVQLMWADLITSPYRKRNVIGKFLEKFRGLLDKAAISIDDLDENDISEFSIRPVLKLAAGVETGAEFEVKWDLSNKTDISKAVPAFFRILTRLSASQLQWRVEKQDNNTSISKIIYVGMPICVYGNLAGEQSTDDELFIKDGVYKAGVLLNQKINKLQPQLRFLQNRRLFILGLVDGVQPLMIQAGIILLSNRTIISIEQVG